MEGTKGNVRDGPRLFGPIFFSISCRFREKMAKIIGWYTPFGLARPRDILDPPLNFLLISRGFAEEMVIRTVGALQRIAVADLRGSPLRPKMFMHLFWKFGKIACWRPILREILDPPLGRRPLRQMKRYNFSARSASDFVLQ